MELVAHLRSGSAEETERFGEALGRLLEAGQAVGLIGELGAGKTCFARGVARGLGVDPRAYVSSPTFTLVNEHVGRLTLYHIDLYRLGDPDELQEIGFDDCLRGEGVCLVEWLDRFPSEAPAERLELRFGIGGSPTDSFRRGEPPRPEEEEEARRLEVRAAGASHLRLARRWAILSRG